jgi:ornithine--oxo-acid transaminase
MPDRHAEAVALWEEHVNPQFARVLKTLGFDRAWVRGEGAHLVDEDGGRWLDLLSGFGVFALGRNHPGVKRALVEAIQADTPSLPAMGVSALPGVLAEQLLARAPDHLGAVVFANSGAEAVEAAIKLARAATGRTRVLFAEKAFHGLTTGALAVNGGREFRERFGPLLPGASPVPFGDLDALERELRAGDVALLLLEPVQGKGVNLPPPGYLRAAQALCHAHGALLCLDEVQTGLGRTGRFLALEHWGVQPDLVTLAKALSGGFVPIGAVLTTEAVRDAVFDTMERAVVHGSTFSGGDLAAAAGLATLAALDDEGLVARSARLGERLLELTLPLVERHEIVRDVRGLGLGPPEGPAGRRLWDAVEHRQPGLLAQLVTVPLFHDHHILIQVAGHHVNVVKALPPLVIDEADLDRFATALDDVLAAASRHPIRATGRLVTGLGRRAALAR